MASAISSFPSPVPSNSFDMMSSQLTEDSGATGSATASQGDLHKTVLRLKRRLDDSPSPSKVLVMSYKRCKLATTTFGENDENHSNEEVRRVFHLAGTVDKDEVDDDKSIAKTIKEALDVVDRTKALANQKAKDSNRCYKQRKSFRMVDKDKTKEEVKQNALDNRFKVISQRRGLPNLEVVNAGESSPSPTEDSHTKYEPTLLFNLLDLVAEDGTGPTEKQARPGIDPRDIGSITVNGVPMIKIGNSTVSTGEESTNAGFVFDLYVAKDPMSEDHFQNQSVSVRPADGDYEFDLQNCEDSDEELCPDDDEDSNEEDNWRNDYPDSDPDNETKEGFAYGYDGPDEDVSERFASLNFKGNDLSTDDEGDYVYSTEYDGCDDGIGGMYSRYKARLRREELADEVVTSESDNDG